MTSLVKTRLNAFQHQSGLCHYCGHLMWLNEKAKFAKEQKITLKEAARFQCTAEHLVARSEGGGNNEGNIVAACFFCNQTRHRKRKPKNHEDQLKYVKGRLAKGKWHPKKNSGARMETL